MMQRRSVLAMPVLACALTVPGCSSPAPAAQPASGATRGDILLARDTVTVDTVVPRDATFETLLRSQGVPADRAFAIIEATRPVFNPRRLRAGQPYRLVLSLDGGFRRLEYEIDADRFLQVMPRTPEDPASALDARVVLYEQETALVAVEASIDADHPSIIAALDEVGEGVPLAVALAEILGGEVDFNTELRVGDRLDVLYEQRIREGRSAGYGHVVAVALLNDGRVVRAFRFVDADGQAGYYDAEGRSLRRMFLRSPLPFEPRVTSGFSRRRLHPIYRTYRPHLGVDYGAPIGTSVVAVANGVVVSAGFSGESGRMVHLRHPGGYETYYLHLSALGPGIRRGVHVEQGQLIGRVGMTGAANGPHLDFRIRQNGVFVNPLTVHRTMPPGKPIAPASLEAFRSWLARAEWQLAGSPAATAEATAATRPDDPERAHR
jgi:murein DD-endopeptidase MepM/ murein hydrolase activator NlpD